MSTKTITHKDAMRAMREAMAEKGAAYVYLHPTLTSCRYAFDGAPSCLVGDALHRLGVPIEVLTQMDDMRDTEDGAGIGFAYGLVEEAGFEVDGSALDAFKAAQREQDGGKTWHEAVSAAEQVSA